ncbi:hypothetical protein FOPG_19470 [Fusarium oxysporum f. sp. conglutinans race 2 54008]|uniref:Uncharacterized protein n=1 Tax=Fusarium oxysporum f. sp. conglutinans race 2 54008 TaxID=1089457 RepID=X0GWP5_FUSOX|nr:hypothetical protein FOPG_19470 [Fusarium oxysporum f. sp. conglutinans race 2 54008]
MTFSTHQQSSMALPKTIAVLFRFTHHENLNG